MLKIQIACEVPPGVKDTVQFESSVMNHITALLVRHGLTHEHEAPNKLEVVAEVEPVLWHLVTGPDDNRQTHEIRVWRLSHRAIAELADLNDKKPIAYRAIGSRGVSDEVQFVLPGDSIFPNVHSTISIIHHK